LPSLNAADEDSRARLVCIGKSVALNLFGDRNANCVGREITVNRARFRVVGILKEKGAGTFDIEALRHE
jgi:hypothetical protein